MCSIHLNPLTIHCVHTTNGAYVTLQHVESGTYTGETSVLVTMQGLINNYSDTVLYTLLLLTQAKRRHARVGIQTNKLDLHSILHLIFP